MTVSRTICLLAAAALSVGLLGPKAALAEAGDGVKSGPGRVHPYVQVETRHVYNPGNVADNVTQDVAVFARPGIDFELGSGKFQLKTKAAFEYQRFLGLFDERTTNLSTWAGQLALDGVVNKGGAAVLRFANQLARRADPGNTITRRLEHTSNNAAVGIDGRPGGGALVFSADYAFFYDYYDRSNVTATASPEALDNMRHTPELKIKWKFLPKTAFFLQSSAVLTRYPSKTPVVSIGAVNEDTSFFTANLGMIGSLTPRISVLAKGGYVDTLLLGGGGAGIRSAVGNLELTYDVTETQKLKVGASRSIEPASLFRYFDMWRSYVSYNHLMFGDTTVASELAYALLLFGANVGGSARVDSSLTANLSLERPFAQWLVLALVEQFELRDSNFETAAGSAGYTANSVFLRATVRY